MPWKECNAMDERLRFVVSHSKMDLFSKWRE